MYVHDGRLREEKRAYGSTNINIQEYDRVKFSECSIATPLTRMCVIEVVTVHHMAVTLAQVGSEWSASSSVLRQRNS